CRVPDTWCLAGARAPPARPVACAARAPSPPRASERAMDDPRYPVGRYTPPADVSPQLRGEWIDQIAAAPAALREAVAGLDEARMDTPYREGGWTVRQVVHHLPDSH